MRESVTRIFFGLCLFTLPWAGVGTVYALTGRDIGGGLQPSWVFLAFALAYVGAGYIQKSALGGISRLAIKTPSSLAVLTFGGILAVLVSTLGFYLAPSLENINQSWARWLRQLVQLLIMFSFVWWTAFWVNGRLRWRIVLDLLFLGALFQVAYSLAQGINFFHHLPGFDSLEFVFTSNPSILSGSERLYVNNMLQEIPRLRGTVCEPLYLGNYILMVWPFLLVWRRPLWIRWAGGTLLWSLLLLTWSRGAWLGLVVQLFLMIFIFLIRRGDSRSPDQDAHRKRAKIFLPWLIGGALLLIVIGDFFSGGKILQRLLATFNNQDWSNLTRLYSMKAAWLAFLESPLVGVGWGQYAFHFPLLVDPMGLQSQFSWPVVNNFPLQILSETGVIGFGVFSWGTVLIYRSAWRILLQQNNLFSGSSMVFSALIGVVGVWVQLLSFSQYNLPHIWVGLGLLLAAILSEKTGASVVGSEGN